MAWQPPRFPTRNRDVWAAFFVPAQTCWDGDIAAYPSKAEALDVLFINHRSFSAGGIGIAREYMQWCDAVHAGDYRISSAGKAKAFLESRVQGSRERWLQEDGRKRQTLVQECAVNSFRVAVTHLDALARWQGYIYPLLKTEEVEILQQSLLRDQAQARAETRDYAATSRFLTKRLTPTDRANIVTAWWTGEAVAGPRGARTASGREWAQVRGLLLCTLQRSLGRRGADLRNIRLAMLFTHELPNTRPISPCPVVGASLRHVKECHENIEHLLGWARARDRWECPLGALALYLVYMNDIAGCNIIDTIRESLANSRSADWHDIMLFQGKDTPANQPISYWTHNQACHAGMDAAGVANKTAVTHLDRNTVGCELIERGVGVEDAGMYQGWYHNTAADVYLRGAFKTEPMLIAHGWDGGREGFECWWEGGAAATPIPDSISDTVFPGLDELYDELMRGTLEDKSAIEFLKCMRLLRRIYISDAIVKQTRYPEFPAYLRHPLFDRPPPALHTTWLEYKATEAARVAAAPDDAKAAKSAWVVEAVREAFQMQPGKKITDESNESPDLTPPAREERIPDIREPDDLYTSYSEWTNRCRDYFQRVTRPPWDKQYGKLAKACKVRYCHVRPYYEYLDSIEPARVRSVIDKLDAIRTRYGVAPATFIKYCFYSLKHGACASKPPAIKPDVLRSDMEVVGLHYPYKCT